MLQGSDFRAIIFNAARENNLDRMKVFLDEERSPDWIEDCLNGTDNEKNCLVIASRYGFIDVVRYLHEKGADVTIRGTVSFDGEVINSAPALWAASAAGHFEVVKYLVDIAGADINQTTATNSTPLRGACYDGHLEIVQYLVDNGADIEIANRHGHTPLMISCFRGKLEVAKYLLAQGANIHKPSHKGNTALHDAAEGDRADICKMLIDAGAMLKEDDTGLCPLMSCSLLGNDSTLAVLLPICTSGIKKRDALKVLGCTQCDKKMNMHGAIRSWRAATAVILTEMEQKQYDETLKNFTVPEVYGDIQEIDTEQDVNFIDGQPDLIHMQSLLIRERVLGGRNAEVHYFIRFRGAVYCDLARVTKCFELWMHALRLQQEYLEPMNGNTYATFQAFQETYALAANEHRINQDIGRQQWPVETKQVIDLLDMLCYELERLANWPKDRPLHECEGCDYDHETEEDKERLVVIGLHLVLLVKRFNISEPVPDVNAMRLVNVCRRLNILPLHLALQEAVDRTDPQVRDEFPSLYVVIQLLKSGCDVDTIDFMRNTPLHVLLLNERPRESIVRALLDAGAPILSRNDQDSTCLDLMELSNLKNIPCGRYISLMGLAANAVNRSGDSCLALEVIPECLHNFLSYH